MVSGAQLDNEIELKVKDNGLGISAEDQAEVFQKFYQLDTSLGRANEGVGLGLFLSKCIVELHRGSITLESQGVPGEGCVFTIRLPLAQT